MNSRLKCQRIFVFLIFWTVSMSRNLETFYFSTYINATAFQTLLPLGLSRCVTECKIRTRCKSVKYSRTGRTCELLDHSGYNGCIAPGLHVGLSVTNKRFVLGCKAAWDMTLYDGCSICNDSEVCNVLPDNTVTCQIKCEAPVSCDTSWVEYGYHCYIENPIKLNWADAQSYCEGLGGYLLSIESRQEQEAMEGFFPSGDFWLGGNDIDDESTWVWVSGNPLTYTFWEDNEPDSYFTYSDCLHCRDTTWKWHDYSCYVRYKSICEKGA